MKTITVNYCGMTGTGATKTRARQDAARKIEEALSGSYTPFVMSYKGMVAVIARDPTSTLHSWGYKLYCHDEIGRDVWLDCNYETRDVAIQACARHLAQNAGSYDGLEDWLTRAEQRDLDGYFAWQAGYAVARVRGASDEECRLQADNARSAMLLA